MSELDRDLGWKDGSIKKIVIGVALGVFTLIASCGAVYTVPEGNVGIVKRFGKAVKQVNPGLHFKVPIADAVLEMDVRERKYERQMEASTQNQMPIQTKASMNWTVQRDKAMVLYSKYGSMDGFEARIIVPRLNSAAKTAIAKYPADQLIEHRQQAIQSVFDEMVRVLAAYPITVNATQLEDIVFPPDYIEAIKRKEVAREAVITQQHELERQKEEAEQKVQTAQAESDAKRIQAEAEAYRVETEARARAEAIRMEQEQLRKGGTLYVEFLRAQKWDGQLPTTLMGGEGGFTLWKQVD